MSGVGGKELMTPGGGGTHRRTGPLPFGGGHNHFCPNFSSLPEKSNMFGQCIFAHMVGGGGGKESSSFEVIEYGTPQRGRVWEGVSPSHGGDLFWKFGY